MAKRWGLTIHPGRRFYNAGMNLSASASRHARRVFSNCSLYKICAGSYQIRINPNHDWH